MAAEKKTATDETTAGAILSLRDDAEDQLARSPKNSPDFKGQTPEELIHELQVHQIELETQAEELRSAHLVLEESRHKYLDLYEFAPLGYLTLTDTALIEQVNLFGAELLAADRKKLFNARFRKFIVQTDYESWVRYFMEVLDHGVKQVCTLMLRRGDDSIFPARLEGVRTTSSDGKTSVRITFSDISDIWQIEALKERLKELNCLYGISALLELPGISLDETLKRTVLLLPPAWQYPEITEASIVLEGSVFQTARFRETSWMQASEIIVNDNPVGRVVVCYREERQAGDEGPFLKEEQKLLNDIAERLGHFIGRKRADEAISKSETRFHTIYDQSPIAIELYDAAGTLVHVNPAGLQLFGVEDIVGIKKFSLFADPNISNEMKERLRQGERVQYQGPLDFEKIKALDLYPTSREGIIWLDVRITPLGNRADSNTGYLMQVQDITGRKVAEEALRETNEYLNNLFDYANAPIIVWDPQYSITRFNHAFEDLTLRPEQEVIGQHLDILFPKDSREASLLQIKKTVCGERWESVELPILVQDGSVRTVLWNSANILDPDGRIISTIAQGIDISERKRAEETLFKINQKIHILSELTRKELATQILILDGYFELAKSHADGQDHIIETLEKGERAIQLIHETIEYSKYYQDMGATPPAWQNVKRTMLFGLSHMSINEITHSIETENLEIFADPLLEKACQRLFESSVQHGGHVTRFRVWHTVTPDGVNLVFEDDGTGIPMEKKVQIFLRGDDTRISVKGLFFVREILDITGISIKETGEPGKGARFEMTVPDGMWRITASGT